MITKEEFNLWQDMPATKEIFEILKESRKYYLAALLNGGSDMVINTDRMLSFGEIIGQINAYDDLLKIDYFSLDHIDLRS